MSERHRRPPGIPMRLLELVVPAGSSRDGLLGDMEERFQGRARGSWVRARAWYWAEAFSAAVRYAAEARRVGPNRNGGGAMGRWRQDLRMAVRMARRRPGFSALVVATLALGIGANTAVFSVIHAVLIQPLPYQAPDRLVMADQLQPTGFRAAVSMPNYRDWHERSTVFDGFAMEKPESFRIDNEQGAEVLEGRLVLGDFFDLFGVEPVVGRLPSAAELGPGAERNVVLTYDQWQSRFGGRSDVVGEILRIDGAAFSVVAVVPPGFALQRGVAFYIPLGLGADDPVWQDRDSSMGGWVVARLRPDVSLNEARADLARVTGDLRAAWGDDVAGAALFTMREWYVGDVRRPLLFLMAGVGLVLLVACANVASLFLGRTEERRGELGLRTALGAGRGQVLQQLLMEILVLCLLGGVAGLGVARLGLDVLMGTVSAALPAAFAESVGIDSAVVWVTLGTVVGVTLLVGLAPALRSTRGVASRLGRYVGAGRGAARSRGFLVAGQMALSVVLLVCTGLLVQSVGNLRAIDAGFRVEGVLTQRVSAPRARYPGQEASHQVQEQIRTEVARLPGVSHVALSNLFPFSRTNWEMRFREPSGIHEGEPESVLYTAASPDYFGVFSIPLIEGRLFTEADRADSEPVVVIDETAAARYWPGADPLGRVVSVDDVREGDEFVPRWRRVVGVVGHVRNYKLTEPSRIEAYVPLTQSAACCRTLWVTARTAGDPAALAPLVRRVASQVDPEMPVYRVSTMRDVIDAETSIHRAVRELFVAFGGLALILGAVGIYGVVAAGAERRRREIGLRLALGSTPSQATRTVAEDGLRWVGAGISLGLVGALAAGRAIESLLVGVRPFDAAALVGASGVLALAALTAVWLPARRAAHIDPGQVLRDD